MPLGKFTNKGDYFEGDLEREKTPKISLAAGYHYNEGAYRSQGTLGKDLYQQRNLTSFIGDILIKYNGFALCSEFLNRKTDNPVTINAEGKTSNVLVGYGIMTQFSYIFKNNIEVATRFSQITPYQAELTKQTQKEEYGLGLTKYLRKHRVKLQGNVYYLRDKNTISEVYSNNRWSIAGQIELGL